MNHYVNGGDGSESLEDVFSRRFGAQWKESAIDLPTNLMFLDVESMLPKLSVLSPGGRE